jgi:S-formylglutathione hydrolase FrmB
MPAQPGLNAHLATVLAVHALAALVAASLLPGFTPVTSPAHGGTVLRGSGVGGTVLRGTFPGGARPGYVYLPPGFHPSRRYPVVYLLHGMPGSPSEYLDGAGLTAFADSAIPSRQVRAFIAVMPAAGTQPQYNGEWGGVWERRLVDRVVPWIDARLPTVASARGRVLAGLSAGGYGAVDIALRHPGVFGTVESWSGYFRPLHDGPFKDAPETVLDANDPVKLVPREASVLRADRIRFFLSSGPAHSHWFKPSETIDFASELRRAGLHPTLRLFPTLRGEWSRQLAAGLAWALP